VSVVGSEQPLRGFGTGRFTDKDGYATSFELRRRVFSFSALSSPVDIEVTPFVDAGRVFADSGTFPLSHVHAVGGVGFRGIARPFVVGYVDIGYGSEGAAVFTGINYPF
jgi:hemolysin activation/secretion protein